MNWKPILETAACVIVSFWAMFILVAWLIAKRQSRRIADIKMKSDMQKAHQDLFDAQTQSFDNQRN